MNRARSLRALALALVLLLRYESRSLRNRIWVRSRVSSKIPAAPSVPNAKVTVKNESGLERQATTNDSGYYTITNIPPGLYTISRGSGRLQEIRKHQTTSSMPAAR